ATAVGQDFVQDLGQNERINDVAAKLDLFGEHRIVGSTGERFNACLPGVSQGPSFADGASVGKRPTRARTMGNPLWTDSGASRKYHQVALSPSKGEREKTTRIVCDLLRRSLRLLVKENVVKRNIQQLSNDTLSGPDRHQPRLRILRGQG